MIELSRLTIYPEPRLYIFKISTSCYFAKNTKECQEKVEKHCKLPVNDKRPSLSRRRMTKHTKKKRKKGNRKKLRITANLEATSTTGDLPTAQRSVKASKATWAITTRHCARHWGRAQLNRQHEFLMRLSQKCVNLRGEVVQERVVLEHDLDGLMLGLKKSVQQRWTHASE
jgi:hypothetical protein